MDTIFINYGNSKTPDPYWPTDPYWSLLIKVSDTINLKGNYKYVALSNSNIWYVWKK